jgi:hypothetical protein
MGRMFIGSHLLCYSADPEADRAFLRDVLGFACVDTGHDWLIFKLPTAEAAVHPLEGPNLPASGGGTQAGFMVATCWLMVADLVAARSELAEKGVTTAEPQTERWGIHTSFALPSGGKFGLYQPLHPTALGL